ncbi:MAG: oxidoreductase [Dactylosporangium sp.]|nr:oxidoreductase [Dactylosporangium sp.]
MKLFQKIRSTGRIAEPSQPGPGGLACPKAAQLGGSVQLRHIDTGSCNGCEIEIGSAFGPVYDAERYGARLVASPRHADALLVTGAVTHNMAQPLCRTVAAAPHPRIVIAVGDCACGDGVFADAYGVRGPVSGTVPVDLRIPGCPPEPTTIIRALRGLTGR